MKRTVFFISIFLIFIFRIDCFAISAKSAVLIDASNGRILYGYNETSELPMASTTKIMTGLIAIENSNPEDIVTVSKKAAYTEGSSMYLKEGEKVSMRELLYGLMLSSGNDAAVAIAEYISGSTEEFAKKMTERARSLNAMQTSFKNPNGLDEEGHYTTAKDLAQITRVAMQNPLFAEIVATKSVTLARGTYVNHNKLLSMYKGINGGKTGYTKKCGRCLVSSCERNGFSLIAVTLNDPDDWNDHISMYERAYSEYQCVSPVRDGDIFGSVMTDDGRNTELVYRGNMTFYLNNDEQKRFEITDNVPTILGIPLDAGQKVGTASAYLDGVLIGQCEIVNRTEVPLQKKRFSEVLYNTLRIWLKSF